MAGPAGKRFQATGFLVAPRKNNDPPIPNHLSSDAKDFLNKCLQRAPYTDSSFDTSELLEHPFFSGGGFKPDLGSSSSQHPQANDDSVASKLLNFASTKGSEVYTKGSSLAGQASTIGSKIYSEGCTQAKKIVQDYRREKEKADQQAAARAKGEKQRDMWRRINEQPRVNAWSSIKTLTGQAFTQTTQTVTSYLTKTDGRENVSERDAANTSAAGMSGMSGKTGTSSRTSGIKDTFGS